MGHWYMCPNCHFVIIFFLKNSTKEVFQKKIKLHLGYEMNRILDFVYELKERVWTSVLWTTSITLMV